MNINEFKITGYRSIHCESHSTHTGGVIAYIEKNLNIKDINVFKTQFLWCLSFKINMNKETMTIAAVYLSASENKNIVLDNFIPWLENIAIGNNLICCGDFNINVKEDSQFSRRLINCFVDNGLRQVINMPTRVTLNSATIIDLCATNLNKNKINCIVSDEDQISDHKNIEVTIIGKTDKNPNKVKTITMWNNYDPEKLWNSINTWILEWEIIKVKPLNDRMDWLLNNLKISLSQFRKTKKLKQKNDFFDNELENMRNEKNRLYKIAQFSKLDRNWHEYRVFKNEYKNRIQTKKYEQTQFKLNKVKGDIKETWRVIKSLLNNESEEVTKIDTGAGEIVDENEIANEFNNFFVNSIKELNEAVPNVDYTPNDTDLVEERFNFKPISISDIKNCVYELKNNTDEFNLNADVMLDCLMLVANPLADIINESFATGIFPDALKTATIIPIQKISGTTKINEFRPVNMLPLIEKIFEKLAYAQLNEYVINNALLVNHQSGFRGLHSCESAINDVLFEWKEAQNESKSIIAVFLDLQRAFETIEPELLIDKLRKYGVQNESLLWFQNYLTNRKQKVKFNNVLSNEVNNGLGVPQGSILGPLLFIMYINDLGNCLKYCKIKMFADDTLIYIICDNIHDANIKLNEDLDCLFNNLCYHKLKLNTKKTKAMIISNKKFIDLDNINIRIHAEKIELVDTIKYLGVVIDKKLKFDENIDYICKKVGKKVNVLSRIKNQLNCQQKIMIYKSIIEPHFTFCSTILFIANKTDIKRLQIVQNKCMRNILKLDRFSNEGVMLEMLNFRSVYQTIVYFTLYFIHKVVNRKAPNYLIERINFKSENERKNTLRNRNEIELSKFTKACSQNSLFYKGIALYNNLPLNIKNQPSIEQFKILLNTHVKEKFI